MSRQLCIAILGLASAPALAQFEGSVSLGTRSLDLDGTETKYREDINLDDGLRIFDLALDYRADGTDNAVDDFTLRASSLGGDPYESIQLSARKYGSYRLRLDRRRSDYFYADTILPPALASVESVTGGDFHLFNFERVRDSVMLDLDLSPATRLNIGLERQTRTGESTTTLDISRDEFELEKPLDEQHERLTVGVAHDFESVTLIFEEALGSFENTSELFLPGASAGADMTDAAELQYFFLDQNYDYDSQSHLLRVLAEPSERLRLSGIWRSEDLDLDQQAAERSLGTAFDDTPLSTDLSGTGTIGRDFDLAGIDFGYTLGDRAGIIAGARSSRLDQTGLASFGNDTNSGSWQIETDSFEVGGEIAFGTSLLLTLGHSSEDRDVRHDAELHATDRSGYFARLNYRHDRLSLQASVEDNSIDDPFAIAAPTDSQRVRVSARYAWNNGISIQGIARRTDVENDTAGWLADTEQADLRLGYRRERLELSAGVSRTEIDRAIDQTVTGGSRQVLYPIAYGATLRLRDVWLRWSATERLAIGGSFGSYDNRGSYPLERDDDRIWIDYALTEDYSLLATYRNVDYTEDAFDAYDAEILELAFRLNW